MIDRSFTILLVHFGRKTLVHIGRKVVVQIGCKVLVHYRMQIDSRVPYLNGGIFQRHQVERLHGKEIQIPDAAFTDLFKFFDQYQWHLDDRPLRDDREINPGVLGYIFEKYINQKQMGAYYTEEDITEYIGKNTIIPFLFDAVFKTCPAAFEGEQSIWSLTTFDPDRYIYAVVRKGTEFALPPEIAAGIDDVSKRTIWNTQTPEEYALHTEIWRETVARHQHYTEVKAKLANREVKSINDFITYNLDLRQFAQVVIENCTDSELLNAFWQAIRTITVLDPTSGSGAFLFAALNILEPLYEACLDRMEAFLSGLVPEISTQSYSEFRTVLDEVDRHPNRRYFIYKSIVVNNLYGVDIMNEAVEIAKLRLFLKLVTQVERVEDIEPLPDIDFNIRAGNTLVGFTSREEVERAVRGNKLLLLPEEEESLQRIETQAAEVDRLFGKFKALQTTYHGREIREEYETTKTELRQRLGLLEEELNRLLAIQYGVDPNKLTEYPQWVESHQPFHWFIDFYGILKHGGFDVMIGNPPYVSYGRNFQYKVKGYKTEDCRDLYAFVIERSFQILEASGRIGVIIPVSSVSTDGFDPLRRLLLDSLSMSWVSNYAERPSKLFSGVEKRLTIWIGNKSPTATKELFLTGYKRWFAEERQDLFRLAKYAPVTNIQSLVNTSIPKITSDIELRIMRKLAQDLPLGLSLTRGSTHIIYYTRQVRYFAQFFDFIPKITNASGKVIPPSELKQLHLATRGLRDAALALLNSNLFFWFLSVHSDVRNLNKREIESFRCSLRDIDLSLLEGLARLSRALMKDFERNSRTIINNYRRYGVLHIQSFQPRLSKVIIDEIDKTLARYYGLTDEELDFIINYDVKYRMGDTLSEDMEGEEGYNW